MAIVDAITRLVKDPAPEYALEFSEFGVAWGHAEETGFVGFEQGTLQVSPVADNFLRAESAQVTLGAIPRKNGNGANKRLRAALILPDYAARVTVVDFDSFPAKPEEQRELVRFRLKKTLPFDASSAAIGYYAQAGEKGRKIEVVAVAVALEVIARYEALARAANFHPGEITTSSLAALNLSPAEGVEVFAKLAGRVLTVMVLAAGIVKLVRCVELENTSEESMLLVIYPTLAYIEDELGSKADQIAVCGFPPEFVKSAGVPVRTLVSRLGKTGPWNAGLLGYLEGEQN